MPLVTLTVRKGKSPQFKDDALAAIHAAVVASGVPKDDKFHRVLELDAVDFRYDQKYPDLLVPRSENFILIEIVLSVGRSVKVKKQILQRLLEELPKSLKVSPEDVMVVFIETRWENWSFAGGRFIHT
jgi:phenylpyruvate tautomerase PptA (4-oxalocrotonate tautomerase family)